MQAIILAAGMGKRLGELTRNNTKCMIQVNGVPLIYRMLHQLVSCSVSRVVMVVGYQAENLMKYVRELHLPVPVVFIENKIYDKTNNIYSLAMAQEYLEKDDTILLESDLIFEDRALSNLLEDPEKNLALVAKYEPWMDGTMVRIDSDRNIVSFIPKSGFKYSEINSYYKTVNIYKFSKEFSQSYYVPFLNAYTKARGENEYYEQVLRVLTFLDQIDFKAMPLSGEKWYEIDDIQDLDIAEVLFAEKKDCLKKYSKRYGGYWRFPQMLDFCYLVNPYFPTSRMKEMLRSSFDALLTEYPSGMGVNSLLAGKYFGVRQNLIAVGNGAAELIHALINRLPGRKGVIYPTFEEYPNRCRKEDIVPFRSNREDFSYSEADLIAYFENKKIDSLLLINPDNPSGNLIDCAGLTRLLKWCAEKQIRLVLDESFADFASEENLSLLKNDILTANPHLIVIKSISKSYGVPGLRLGVLATADEILLKQIKGDLPIWNINSFAEYYMQIFGKYEATYYKACDLFRNERERFQKALKQISFLKVFPSQANYFLCKLTGKYTSGELTELLLTKYNILIKDCSGKAGFEGASYIRIAIRDADDNQNLINALESL